MASGDKPHRKGKIIRIYLEGNRSEKKDWTTLRQGFETFLSPLRERANKRNIRLKVVTCGSRSKAFSEFKLALKTNPEIIHLLLVDSEGPVHGDPWIHLQKRKEDKWNRPKNVSDEHCHLMVQSMEAWLIADIEALKKFYGQGFAPSSIPQPQNVETIEKPRLLTSLKRATQKSAKRKYHKANHAPKILALLDPKVVRKKALHCERLFATLETMLK